ncbi:hypothetical protein KAR91_18695 [Candidatus Pacearchaeota archaeon]|nr:hypothetical protein [Candidatus Pacearchaeota archaeon]
MAETTIVQHWLVTQFILPFLLIWFVSFALLEKSKLLGEGKQQLNAMTAAVLAAIFVGALEPTMIVTNMVLFLTVSIIIVFVGLILWGFVSGNDLSKEILHSKLKWPAGILIFAAVILAVTWSSGINNLGILSSLFNQSWSETFWTNVAFIAVVVGAITAVLWKKASS